MLIMITFFSFIHFSDFVVHNKNMKTYLFCIEIFLARALDVSIGAFRTIFLVKGKGALASLFAFFEIIIWFIVVKKVIIGDLEIGKLLFYAGGYAFGTYIGVLINQKIVNTNILVTIITSNKSVQNLLKNHFNQNIIISQKCFLLIIIKNKELKKVKTIIKDDPNSILTIQNIN